MTARGPFGHATRRSANGGRTRLQRAVAVAAVLGLLATACTAEGDADEPADASVDTPDEVVAEPASDAPVRRVQDLLVVTGLRTLDEQGEPVELLDEVLDAIRDDAGTPVDLGDDTTFTPAERLDPSAVKDDGTPRDDIDVVAGILATPDGDTLLVAASSDPAGDGAPIGHANEHAVLDLTFLDELLAPGDPLFVDHAFGQTRPLADAAAEDGLDPMALLAARVDAGSVAYLGTPGENGALTDEPLVLIDQPARVVEGSTKGEIPIKAQPMVDGFWSGVRGAVNLGVKAVQRFFRRFGDGATESNDLIDENLDPDPFPTPTPTPPPPPPENRPPDCEWVSGRNGQPGEIRCHQGRGDPHFVSLDGLQYSYQGVGEYVSLRGDDVEVQIRTAGSDTADISQIVAVAVGHDGHTVEVVQLPEPRVLIDGERLDDARLDEGPVEVGGITVSQRLGTIRLGLRDGDVVVEVARNGRWVAGQQRALTLLTAVPSSEEGVWAGFAGNGDGDPTNDLTTRGGEQLADPQDFDEVVAFADSWRLTDEESLFTYADGESTATFTDRSRPGGEFRVDDLEPGLARFARAVCERAGITDPLVLDTCTLDYATTRDMAFLVGARFVDAVVTGRMERAGDGDAAPDDQGAGPLPQEVAWFTDLDAPLTNGSSRTATVDDELALVNVTNGDVNELVAVELEDGTIRWRTEVASNPAATIDASGAIVAAIVADDDTPVLAQLDRADGSILGSNAEVEVAGTSLVALAGTQGGVAVVDDDVVTAIDATTLEPRWTVTPQASLEDGGIATGDALVVVGYLRNAAIVFHLDADTGEVVGQLPLPELGSSTIELTDAGDDRVVLLAWFADTLARVDLTDGDPVAAWTTTFGDDERASTVPRRVLVSGDVVNGWTTVDGGPGKVGIGLDDGQILWTQKSGGFDRFNGAGSPYPGGFALRPSSDWLELLSVEGELVRLIEQPAGGVEGPTRVGPTIDAATGSRLVVTGSGGDIAGYMAVVDVP